MAWPDPVRGLVIRYSYLWHNQALQGRDEGVKDRPCAIVVAARSAAGGGYRVMVAPVTHSPPHRAEDAVAVPARIGTALGLDDAASWIVTTEVNVFTWPGPDIRPARGRNPVFGRLPHALIEQVRLGLLQAGTRAVERD